VVKRPHTVDVSRTTRDDKGEMKLLPHQIYLAALKPRLWYQLFRKPSKREALRDLRYWTGQDFGGDVEKWRKWIDENVETFYASGSNGVRYSILVSTETSSAGAVQEVLRTHQGDTVIRLEKGKYRLVSEFLGDQVLTTYDPNRLEN
jgi:hypothetical protein